MRTLIAGSKTPTGLAIAEAESAVEACKCMNFTEKDLKAIAARLSKAAHELTILLGMTAQRALYNVEGEDDG